MARSEPEPPPSNFSIPAQTLVVDAGAHTIKAGLVSWQDHEVESRPHIIPNCIVRSRTKRDYVGSALSQCDDFGEMQFRRPVERGYVINWDVERAIFEHEFLDAKAPLYCDPSTTSLILTEPSNGPAVLSSNADQIVFEEFGFAAAARVNGPSLNALNPLPASTSSGLSSVESVSDRIEILLLIDSSHSATTITPLLRGSPIHRAVRRITVGGKHISNYLAELISLRHFRLVDDPYIVEQIKEDACFVSNDFTNDLERCWRGPRGDRRRVDEELVIDYVLPDYDRVHRGYVQRKGQQPNQHKPSTADRDMDADADDDMDAETPAGDTGATTETFPMGNERFVAPELLFNPLDIGLRESGICDTVMQSLSAVPRPLWQGLLANVVCVGGNTLLPGFVERVQAGLRALAPSEIEVYVAGAEDPITATWRGGARLAGSEHSLANVLVSRDEYLERGEAWVMRKFARNRIAADWGSRH